MKKKVLMVASALALLAIMVSGSLAYFTAEDKVTNTFTLGSVEIEIFENEVSTDDDTIVFGKLIPVVSEIPSEDENYFKKVVDVKNTGENAAYIRVHVAIPTALVSYLRLDFNLEGWSDVVTTTAEVEGVAYTVFSYDHLEKVQPGDFSAELLLGAYLQSAVDLEEDENGNLLFILRNLESGEKIGASGFVAHTKNANGTYTSNTISLLVAAQAIQDRGFEDVGATEALNTGFGANTNPWAN